MTFVGTNLVRADSIYVFDFTLRQTGLLQAVLADSSALRVTSAGSAVALPADQDYTKRAKMSELILAASACRTTITEIYQSGGTTPSRDETRRGPTWIVPVRRCWTVRTRRTPSRCWR